MCFSFYLYFSLFKSILVCNKLNVYTSNLFCLWRQSVCDLLVFILTHKLFHLFFSPSIMLKRGSERAAVWGPGSSSRSTCKEFPHNYLQTSPPSIFLKKTLVHTLFWCGFFLYIIFIKPIIIISLIMCERISHVGY